MRTTVELPDHLFRMAKRVAAARGSTLRDLFTLAMEHELGEKSAGPVRIRRALPVVRLPPDAPILGMSTEDVGRADGEAEQEHLNEVYRRR